MTADINKNSYIRTYGDSTAIINDTDKTQNAGNTANPAYKPSADNFIRTGFIARIIAFLLLSGNSFMLLPQVRSYVHPRWQFAFSYLSVSSEVSKTEPSAFHPV